MMNDIFNDAYINCRFSCIYNVANYFGVDPMYIIANNYYLINKDKYSVENIYYLPYKELFKILGIKIKNTQLIKSVNDIELKNDEIAILKIQGEDDTLIGDKTIKSNMIILNRNSTTSNLIWRDSSNIKIFKYMKMNNDDIDNVYCKYLNEYYPTDKEPTLNIFSRYKTNKSVNPFFRPHVLSYKLFTIYENEIKNNVHNLKLLLNNSDNDKIMKFINKFCKRKKAELYKFKHLFSKKKIDSMLERQIEILEVLGYHILKQSPKKNTLIEELVNLEEKITKKISNIKAEDMFENNIKINKDFDLQKIEKINNYLVESINIQNNSINGVAYKNSKKYFYKIQKKDSLYSELMGYFTIYNHFPIPDLCDVYVYNNCGIIIYEYDNTIKNNEGLLCDALQKNDAKIDYKFLDIILKNYKYYIYNKNYPMQKFYKERITTRLNKYFKSNWYNYEFIINNESPIMIKEIFDEINKYFKRNKINKCVLSHGDLNTTNIGLKPIFMDFTTSGYNCIEAEIALFSISILFIDLYFSPKYHKNSYRNHENACKHIPKIECEYKVDKEIIINSYLKTTSNRKKIIEKYLENLNYNENNLLYYLLVRILTIFDIDKYEDNDKYYSLFLFVYFYKEMKINKKTFKEIVREMDVYDNII